MEAGERRAFLGHGTRTGKLATVRREGRADLLVDAESPPFA
jgi:hypothetical protein